MRRSTINIIKTAIASPEVKVVSFDVFDTLLLRPFWKPVDLFKFLDREATGLLGAFDEIKFSEYRKEAEKKARLIAKQKNLEDVKLTEIYTVLKNEEIFPESVTDALMAKEMELERRFCYARKSAVELVKYAISKGKRIIAISDMYLPSEFIGQLLEKNEIPLPERVFVSCEVGYGKASGKLYDSVLDTLKIEKSEIVHIGDNIITDVKVPRKKGIKAFPYYRPVDLLSGTIPNVCRGRAFKYAYKQNRAPFPNRCSLQKLGIKCMLAVAANSVFDDPFRGYNKNGDYARDEQLFGNLALGLYCMAHALWVHELTTEKNYDRVLFFSRDGYLPFIGYNLLREFDEGDTPAEYVRTSRKALFPLVFTSAERVACTNSFITYKRNSPESLSKLLESVLKEEAIEILENELGIKWKTEFATETELACFAQRLYDHYIDKDKMKVLLDGFKKYYEPLMGKSILTYDVGYNLRNEIILHSFFPETGITASYTHSTNDVAIERSKHGRIMRKTFYSSAPYVSWLPRELFLTEDAPTCLGYLEDGKPQMSRSSDGDRMVARLQEIAVKYMKEFTAIFKEDTFWLPMDYQDACLPYETFLHSPSTASIKWVRKLEAENEFDSGLKVFNCFQYWYSLRTDYLIAHHHLEGLTKYAIRFVMLFNTDRNELKKRVHDKLKKSE